MHGSVRAREGACVRTNGSPTPHHLAPLDCQTRDASAFKAERVRTDLLPNRSYSLTVGKETAESQHSIAATTAVTAAIVGGAELECTKRQDTRYRVSMCGYATHLQLHLHLHLQLHRCLDLCLYIDVTPRVGGKNTRSKRTALVGRGEGATVYTQTHRSPRESNACAGTDGVECCAEQRQCGFG